MSGSNRNFVLAYVVLVILPLLGLAGILRTGRNVIAPVTIDGLWSLRVDSAQIDSLPCGKALAAVPDKTMAIVQSGKTFVLTFPGGPSLTGSGTLEGTTLQAGLMPARESHESCAVGSELSLLASVDRKLDSNVLTGTLSAPNCQSCASVGFHAERQPPPMSKEGR
jgi:hypothetical protein